MLILGRTFIFIRPRSKREIIPIKKKLINKELIFLMLHPRPLIVGGKPFENKGCFLLVGDLPVDFFSTGLAYVLDFDDKDSKG